MKTSLLIEDLVKKKYKEFERKSIQSKDDLCSPEVGPVHVTDLSNQHLNLNHKIVHNPKLHFLKRRNSQSAKKSTKSHFNNGKIIFSCESSKTKYIKSQKKVQTDSKKRDTPFRTKYSLVSHIESKELPVKHKCRYLW